MRVDAIIKTPTLPPPAIIIGESVGKMTATGKMVWPLLCAVLFIATNVHQVTAASCNIQTIEEVLSVDSVCADSFTRVTGLGNYSQIDLDLAARYLCGTHCGAYFFDGVNMSCPYEEASKSFQQLHCAQNTAYSDTVTSYCVYSDIYVNLTAVKEACADGITSCPSQGMCATKLAEAKMRLGCCLPERFNNTVGYLRSEDSNLAILGNMELYNSCGVTFPSRCEAAYVNGQAVYTDPVPATTASGTIPRYLASVIFLLAAITTVAIKST